ncbi:MarR family winged helix-turn-helix transcriptional regulator [Paracoccus alkenifer]|uniref:DNA-binding transcriptional regulator, MarR family n=1 Tax=Paracoccus alkenifer TaxID=65735 RepID=A0A1H6LWH1_9RHOB|nr:MarR family winged helix-turn-helix transcriptional regulator [Paracoccus alkenifer]SEH90775.1 DNA-binding transcriptional regulator, MarR family [Paracoccus alkenifer]
MVMSMRRGDEYGMPQATEAGAELTGLILALFRTSNRTLAWGDRLVAPLGLTSARWQVLGAIALAEHPQPVAWLARDLGANRQNVQRIVNDLLAEGLVTLEPNPHHRRARLVVLTDKGRAAYETALARYTPRVNALAEALSLPQIETARQVLATLRELIEAEDDTGEGTGDGTGNSTGDGGNREGGG